MSLRETEHPLQVVLGILAILGSFNSRNHFVQDVECLDKAFQYMCPILGFLQLELRPVRNDFTLMVDIGRQHRFKPQLLRGFVHDGNHIEIVRNLQVGFLEQISQDPVRVGILLQLHDDAKPFPSALVPNLGDAFDFFLKTNVFHCRNQSRLNNLIRNFRDDDLLFTTTKRFDVRLGSQIDATFACPISVQNALAAHDDTAGREVRAFDKRHDLVQLNLRLLHDGDARIDHFPQIVRRDFGGEARGDPASSVHKQIRVP
ncbi:Uncharacterised protein [Actinobacillus pleuropneumoniae]|nr:Uncharacterised protein [Actinobacillus pleuropneumoniae]